ncbi:septum formation initiator family protein [Qipengyuania sp. MTN3-11]|uniref:FtsB family cell division protein n=1 Tax=Qipengyuania sp. MTN3-11 TaxID=3056557 RepID=UPI0036F42324
MTKLRDIVPGLGGGRTEAYALVGLLLMGGLAVAGPSGLLAWSENLRLREQRQAQLAVLSEQRDALKNRVELLHPDHADPDMVGELLRSQMNVVHPDEVVIQLED